MANEDRWLALLVADDVDGFNAQRTERTRIELFASDLSGRRLGGVDLSNANLEKSDLTGTDLTGATLIKASLAGIDGSGAVLREVAGARSRFKEAWLDGADLTGADFAQADFAEANLERTRGEGVRFNQARLRGVKARAAVWRAAHLGEARLDQADFRGADLRNADLNEAFASGADFSDAQLDGVSANGAKMPGAKLVGARMTAARLVGANLAGADLSRCDLAAADLSRANLTNAVLHGAILRGAVLADANLEGVRLEGVDLTEADLTGLDPAALGLDAQVTSSLSGFGIEVDEHAGLFLSDLSVARLGGRVAVVWENPEGEPAPAAEGEEPEEPRVVRVAVVGDGPPVVAVVPVPGGAVLDRQVIAWKDGFRVVVTRSRPEGAALIVFPLSRDGALGVARTVPLGYDPAVRPVLREDGGRLLLYGLARRGPTIVIHDLTEGDPRPIHSQASPTARGFIHGQPVLACKGGVVVAVGPAGAQPPRRCPENFPGTLASAVALGTDILALWAVPRVGRTAGGVRLALIGRRHAPKEEALGAPAQVAALAAIRQDDERARVVWVDAGREGGATSLWSCLVPGGEPERLDAPADIAELQLAPGIVALIDAEGRLVALDPDEGTEIARWDATPPATTATHG